LFEQKLPSPTGFGGLDVGQRQRREIFVDVTANDPPAPLGATSQSIQMSPRWGFSTFRNRVFYKDTAPLAL
jgi:hypothetical protein